ncbi:MAG: Asp23/Gls24 family envelope stress response protein [Verrucomicrobia bacterium]|nr:Asp23/Gls24 family envelope stress response protein [Verrucomicrobiota bacterium]
MDQENYHEEEHNSHNQNDSLGSIHINHDVVASIVNLAAREVNGVVAVGSGGLKEDLAGLIGKKSGVTISEDESNGYAISIKLVLTFGVQLAKVAEEVQYAVKEKVEYMTNQGVARVDVTVEGVRYPEPEEDEDNND